MAKAQPITSLPRSPNDDRRRRVIVYTIQMSIRVLCLIACLFVHGWWILIPALGAVGLPLIAVVFANAIGPREAAEVLRPGALQRRADDPL